MISLIACNTNETVYECTNGATITVKPQQGTCDLSRVYAGVLKYDSNGKPIDRILNETNCKYTTSTSNGIITATITVDGTPYTGTMRKNSSTNKYYIEFYGNIYTEK